MLACVVTECRAGMFCCVLIKEACLFYAAVPKLSPPGNHRTPKREGNRNMLALVLVPPTAFVAPSRSTIVVPARAAVRLESERPETEMEYLKRKFDEKGERGGGWSIFKAKGEDAKPDPPWLQRAKQRSEKRAERIERTKRPWWQGAGYSDEDYKDLPPEPSVPWFKRMDDSPAEESPVEESSAPAADADEKE